MASTQTLKHRIRSVANTKQITKAMQMVSASKMRRAQESTKASAPYSRSARRILTSISKHTSVSEHILFKKNPVGTRLLIVIASDKGLAGAYNNNIFKAYTEQLRMDEKDGIKNKTITIGRKISQFASRIKNTEIVGSYESLPDKLDGKALHTVLDTAQDYYVNGTVDAVDVIYTEFISGIKQEVVVSRLLPAGFEPIEARSDKVFDAVYEPSFSGLIDAIGYRLVGAQLFQALLDARASEHSMRMLAMKNATDNAVDLIDDLTLAMNKARQGAITQELAEISGGVEALVV